MCVEPHGRRAGRWAVAVGAAALIGGGGLGGIAFAGGDPVNVGGPGQDGEDVTCTAYMPPENEPVCNVVGYDGADGASANHHR